MSYSFNIKAATKAEAKAAVEAKIDEVVVSQPSHTVDRDAAVAAANAFIDLVVDPAADQQISVSVNGSAGWRAEGEYTGAGFGVSASVS